MSPVDAVAQSSLTRVRHFLVGDVTVHVHGWGRFVRPVVLSLIVLPFSCLFSLWLWVRGRRVVVGIAQNGHANASHFVQDYEPFNRRHLAGEFGDAKVVFVADRIPVGPCLWREISGGSRLHLPEYPQLYRCLPANRCVERLYLSVTTKAVDTVRGYGLPDVVPPSRGLPLPASAASRVYAGLADQPFVLMQVHRPEMLWGLQQAAGRREQRDRQFAENISQQFQIQMTKLLPYREVQRMLGAVGYPVVDLWEAVGNPAELISGRADDHTRSRDELQAWLFANCEIFLSGASGAWWIAFALGRPTLVTDAYTLGFYSPKTMLLPSLLWDSFEHRLVTISEIGTKLLYFFDRESPGRYEKIDNTPEEIAEAVLELRAITRGEAEVDAELQARVSQLAHSSFPPGKPAKPMPLMGQGFLRRHPEILA